MKKILFVLLTALSAQVFAAEEFDFNQSAIDQEFQTLNAIEHLVNQQPNLSFEELQESHPELVSNLSAQSTDLNQTAGSMPLVGPFWWGCVLGIIGLLLVYIVTDNDKAQLKSALIGCVVGTLVWGTAWALSGSLIAW